MTAHKSKGLEADRVFVLCKTFKDGFRTYSSGEEGNLKYVAATRAKKVLAFVEPDFDLQAVEQQFAAGKEEP
jgi:ATP-dependent exoDNAse (exonuclease V) beta subunit